jgi:hypothetical protein
LNRTAIELLESDSPQEALVTWLHELVDYVITVHGLSARMMACRDDETSALHTSCMVITSAMNALLARAQEAGTVRPDALGDDLGRLVHGIVLAAEADRSDSGIADRLLALALDGLRPR